MKTCGWRSRPRTCTQGSSLPSAGDRQISDREFISHNVSISQPPHKIVNLLFAITNWNNELTVWWGGWLSIRLHRMRTCGWRSRRRKCTQDSSLPSAGRTACSRKRTRLRTRPASPSTRYCITHTYILDHTYLYNMHYKVYYILVHIILYYINARRCVCNYV